MEYVLLVDLLASCDTTISTVPDFLNLFILSSAVSHSNSGNLTLFSTGHHFSTASEIQPYSESVLFCY